MLSAVFRPLERWSGPKTSDRRRATFRASWSQTLALLEREIAAIHGRDVVIELRLEREDIRNDGWPRSNARPAGPEVILSLLSAKVGPLSFPCDRYNDWKDNLRAIALGLEALRAVDRYGVTRRAEQYRGWKQLPGGAAADGEGDGTLLSASEALREVIRMAGWQDDSNYAAQMRSMNSVVLSRDAYRCAYRAAAKRVHPDSATGSHATFVRLQKLDATAEQYYTMKGQA